jgi:hypothetical protein
MCQPLAFNENIFCIPYFVLIDTHSMWKKVLNNLVTHAGSDSLDFCTYLHLNKKDKNIGVSTKKCIQSIPINSSLVLK